jgi:hypothetical protein
MIRQRAMEGSPLLGQAQQQNLNTTSGGYLFNPGSSQLLNMGTAAGPDFLQSLRTTANGGMLNSNPYVDSMFNQAAGQVKSQVGSMFEGAGRYGSSGMADAAGRTMDNLATQIYGGNYANERNLQQNASSVLGQLNLGGLSQFGNEFAHERSLQTAASNQAPGLAQADYFDPNALATIGGQQDQRSQQVLGGDIARWDYNQNQPQQLLSYYNAILNGAGNLGGVKSTTQSGGGSPLMTGVGGLMMANSLFGKSGMFPGAMSGLFGGAGGDALASGLAGVGSMAAGTGMTYADALAAGLIAL